MCFDRGYHSPMKFLNIRNSKKFIFFSWYQLPHGLSEGQNPHFTAFVGVRKSFRKIFLVTILLQRLLPCYTQKKQIKNAINLPERAQKLKKSYFRWISSSIRTQIFTLTRFLCMTKSSPIFFLLLNCSIGLPHTTHKK